MPGNCLLIISKNEGVNPLSIAEQAIESDIIDKVIISDGSNEETFRRLVNPPINIPMSLLTSLQLIVVMHRDRRKNIRRVLQITELIPSSGLKEMKIDPTPAQFKTLKVGRNDPCPCASGKKFKKCCLIANDK